MGTIIIKQSDKAYFHVKVECGEALSNKVYGFDYDDIEEIKKDIVLPFLNKQQFLVDGTRIEKNAQSISIYKSSFPIEECVDLVNRSTPQNVIVYFDKTDILPYNNYVDDITKEVLKSVKSQMNDTFRSSNPALRKEYDCNSRKVFVVHGHDDGARESVEAFLRSIDMTPIILFEQHNLGKTIIEKIESNSKDVVYAIVLYSPCDEGKAKEEKVFHDRARQNVVFEHGYLMGIMGRERITALVKGDVETPGDIMGIVYVEMDDRNAWRFKIARELNALGVHIDFTKIAM